LIKNRDGGNGYDVLIGGGFDDSLTSPDGNDILIGDHGTATLLLFSATNSSPSYHPLSAGTYPAVSPSDGADYISQTTGNNILIGGGGDGIYILCSFTISLPQMSFFVV
jgi:hypothetical protein